MRYYEALSRLHASDGTVIQYMKVAGPAGLMTEVDNLLHFRCVQIVWRMTHKSRGLSVFCNISADTPTDQEFIMHANRNLAGHIA